VKKDWLNILDNQNGNYRGNQSVIDTSQLANSNKYMNYREAYLAVPMVMTLTGAAVQDQTVAANSLDYCAGLKNWFGSIIHSFTLDLGGTTIIQQTPYSGLWNTFKLITSLSWGDVQTMGSSIGFYPDDALAVTFTAAATTDGLGTENNQNFQAFPVVSGAANSYNVGNIGLLKRQQYINYNPAGLTAPGDDAFSTLLTAAACTNLYKSYISTKTATTLQISIMAIIQLKHVHSFFQNVPLLKGVFMKATLNLNQPQVTVTTGAGLQLTQTAGNTNSPLGGVVPIMIASARANNGSASLAANQPLRVSLAVGNAVLWQQQITDGAPANTNFTNSINLYVPAYTFNPVYEQAYLSNPVKRIVYTDIYQYQILNVSNQSGMINNLVTNGIANIKSVLICPYYNPTSGTAIAANTMSGLVVNSNTGLKVGMPVWQSPFDPAGCCATSPMSHITNFNVQVSGQNMLGYLIHHQIIHYKF